MTDTFNKYPSTGELQDVIQEYVKHGNLLYFLQGKGIYYFNTSHKDSSQLSSRIFFDEDEINKLRQFAYRNSSNSLIIPKNLNNNNSINNKLILKKDEI